MTWVSFTIPTLAASVDDSDGTTNPIAFDAGISAQSIIAPKMEGPAGSFPTVSSPTSVTNTFANDQSVTSTGNLDTTIASNIGAVVPTITVDGMNIQDGAMTGSNYLIGTGHYWEEGIVMMRAPFPIGDVRHYGSHSFTSGQFAPRGLLELLRAPSGAVNFRWRQADAAGTGLETYTMTDIDIPITEVGPATPPNPFYYRFIRNKPIGSNDDGQINIRTYIDGVAASQTITGVAASAPRTTDGTQHLGYANQGGQNDTFLWWRSQGTDVATTATTGFSDYEAAPAIYTSKVYTPTSPPSTPWIDSGAADMFWQAINLLDIETLGGGALEWRAAAVNVIPTGVASAEFTGSWTPATTGTADLRDLQGRYLGIQFRYTPGTQYPLTFGRGQVKAPIGASQTVGRAFWSQTTHVGTEINLTTNGEGAAAASLPYPPELAENGSEAIRRKLARFELAYAGTRALGTTTRRSWRARWVLSAADADTLEAFFEARRAGEEAFTFTPQGEPVAKAALASSLTTAWLAPDAKQLTGDIVEVL